LLGDGDTRGIFLEDLPSFLPGEKFENGGQEVKLEEVGTMMVNFCAARMLRTIIHMQKVLAFLGG